MSSRKSYDAEVRQGRVLLVAAPWFFLAINLIVNFSGKRFAETFPIQVATVVAIFASGLLARRFPIRRRGVLTVRENVLLLDGQPILEHRNIRGVFPVVKSDCSVLIAQRGIRTFRGTTIELASREDVAALIDDLKWDEAHAAQEFTLANIGGTSKLVANTVLMGVGATVLIAAAFALHIDPKFVMPLYVLLVLLSVSRNMITKVRVGTDGLLVKTGGKKRFIPYQEITSVEHSAHDVTVHLGSGESVRWLQRKDTRFNNAVSSLNPVSLTTAVFQRIENARSLFSSRAEIRSHLLAALKRDGRSLTEWRLAATALSHEQYRVAATPRDVLENIVQDSAVAPDVRIGAAIALHADAGMRVRVATETSALPELGKAIDAALDGDDPALEKAISTLKLDA